MTSTFPPVVEPFQQSCALQNHRYQKLQGFQAVCQPYCSNHDLATTAPKQLIWEKLRRCPTNAELCSSGNLCSPARFSKCAFKPSLTSSKISLESALSLHKSVKKLNQVSPQPVTTPISSERPFLQFELSEAVRAVEHACALCLNVRAGISDDGDSDEGDARLKKQDATPVTVADFGVQALISLELRRSFPDVPLLGEEDASQLRDQIVAQGSDAGTLVEAVSQAVAAVASPALGAISTDVILDAIDSGPTEAASCRRYWILDPIDGTRGFLRGGDSQYVIALALVEDGEVVLGVCGCPNRSVTSLGCDGCSLEGPLGEQSAQNGKRKEKCEEIQGLLEADQRGIIMYASRGQGTWVRNLDVRNSEPRRVQVDAVDRLWDARFCISDHETWGELPLAAALAGTPYPNEDGAHLHSREEWEAKQLPLCCGSICKYVAVALGVASIFVQHPVSKPQLKVWDHAAAYICLLEAGGHVTDFEGRPLKLGTGQSLFTPAGGGVVVSNGRLHQLALDAVKKGQELLAKG